MKDTKMSVSEKLVKRDIKALDDNEEELRRMKDTNVSVNDAIKLLDDTILAWEDPYGIAYKRKAYGKSAIRYVFITGGWSENEHLQAKLDRNNLLNRLFWQKSERGGLTIYEVPTL